MSKKRTKLDDQVRALINASGLSRYEIANECGMTQSALSRFMAGKVGLSMVNMIRLADFFGWEIVATRKPKT
jgi:transcriptional regulator with XRE-family HTH domain